MFSIDGFGVQAQCSLFAVLEVRLSELEAWLCTMEKQSEANVVSQPPLSGVGQTNVDPSPQVVSEQLGSQSGWGTVQRKHSPKQKSTVRHQLVCISSSPQSATHPLRNKI